MTSNINKVKLSRGCRIVPPPEINANGIDKKLHIKVYSIGLQGNTRIGKTTLCYNPKTLKLIHFGFCNNYTKIPIDLFSNAV